MIFVCVDVNLIETKCCVWTHNNCLSPVNTNLNTIAFFEQTEKLEILWVWFVRYQVNQTLAM